MIDYYIEHQLNYMMVLAGISGFVFLFLLCMKIDDKCKKDAFLQISLFAMILLLSDRLAYLYRGDTSILGYWMVRIVNFLVYASIILADNGFTNYLISLAKAECMENGKFKYLMVAKRLAGVGLSLLIISQFTGLYYTFNDTNHYVRSHGFIICYIIPLIITLLQLIFIVKNRAIFSKKILINCKINRLETNMMQNR